MRTLDELADEVFTLCYYSEGGLTFDVRNAPPAVRLRFAKNLVEAKEREKQAMKRH